MQTKGEPCLFQNFYLSYNNLVALIRVFILASILLSFSHGASVGDVIKNTAKASYAKNSINKIVASNEIKTTIVGTKPTIEFHSYTPSSSSSILLGASSYLDSSAIWQLMPTPILPNGHTISTTSQEPLALASQYATNDVTIISLTDTDRNIDSNVREIIEVVVSSPTGDIETIKLIETTINSGVFTGYLPLEEAGNTAKNGKLWVRSGNIISVKYLDQSTVYETTSAVVVSASNKDLWVEKSVNKSIVGIGDSVLYTIRVHNENSAIATNITLADLMPKGLKYKTGTFKLNGVVTTPTLSLDGLILSVVIPTIPSKGVTEITIVATVGAVDGKKELINQAWATSSAGEKSNIATASLIIKEELFRNHGIILGQVYDNAFKNDKKTHGVGGVRIYLENGTFVVTDKNVS